MRHIARARILLLPALLLIVSGCATKNWVRDRLSVERAQSDERFSTVETRVTAVDGRIGREAERVEGMGFRLKSLEESVGMARDRAEGAHTRATELDSRLTRLWKNRHKRTLVDLVQVRFGFGRADLDDAARTALAALSRELKENSELSVDLEGYTDSRGAREYNVQLSQRRVEAVRRYLVSEGVELSRIHAIGLGPLSERGTTDQAKRRVSVKLTINPD